MKSVPKLVNAIKFTDIIGKIEDINTKIIIEDVDTVLIEDTLAKLIHEFFKCEGFYELYTNYLIDSIKIGDDSITLKVKYEEDLL